MAAPSVAGLHAFRPKAQDKNPVGREKQFPGLPEDRIDRTEAEESAGSAQGVEFRTNICGSNVPVIDIIQSLEDLAKNDVVRMQLEPDPKGGRKERWFYAP